MSNIIQENDNILQILLKAGVTLPHVENKILNTDIIDWHYIGKKLLNHDSTDATKSNKEIQKELALSLLFISEDIKNNNLTYETQDVQKIYDTFRNHIQRSYQLGIAYANNIFNSKGFIDDNDLKIIKYLSEYYTQVFVNSINKILIDPKFLLNIDRSILDIQNDKLEKSNIFNYLAHAVSATFQSLQIGTVVKTIVLYNDNSVLSSGALGNAAGDPPTLQFSWVGSMGERQCPICTELAKMTWDIGDWGNIPSIPFSSHPRCRCRIIITPSS